MTSPKSLVLDAFVQKFGQPPEYLVRAPGRVNLLGEHVDYNDGLVLPAAIDRATWLAFSAAEQESTLIALDFEQQAVFRLENLPAKTSPDGAPLPEWALYPAGVAWALSQAGREIRPMRAVFASDVPRGAGLSSSASVEMAFALAWQTLGGWNLPPMERALIGQKAENQYVGVNCGIMDQFASACGVENGLLLLDTRSLEWRSLPLPADVAIVVADTGVRRKLTSGEYNRRRAACEQAVEILRADLPGIRSLRDVAPQDFNRLAAHLPLEVEKRARHVVEEIARSELALAALQRGDLAAFGGLMNDCHASLRDLYEVSIEELNVMARLAQSLPGCYGARLTGAGFGGCTVNLVAQNQAGAFAEALAAGYRSQTGKSPEIYICKASQGAALAEL
ncbi:MAG: galactokinase [Anaerolineales bacterium]